MNRTRSKQIVIRVSEDELALIKENVAKSGKNQQQYMIDALTRPAVINIDKAAITGIAAELQRQGNNLNQIARKLNEGGYPGLQAVERTMGEVNETWQSLKQYLQSPRSARH